MSTLCDRACESNAWPDDLEIRAEARPSYDDRKYWLIDLPVSGLMLLVLGPILLICLALVRLTSRGPAIYSQMRLGRDRREFRIYKIRSMYLDSEKNGPQWCVPGDRRVTPIGRILRATHLDELPQLWNIFRGDMSLIGPRPERPEIARSIELALPGYAERLRVRPGLTGLAQVQHPPDENLYTAQCKLNYDNHYIEHMNVLLDLRILIATWMYIAKVPSGFIARCFGFPDSRLHAHVDERLREVHPVHHAKQMATVSAN